MASSKERQRWERWYDMMTEKMKRQKKSLDRLVLVNMECVAALNEIAAMDGAVPDGQTTPQEYAQERARLALTRIEEIAAAVVQSVEESEDDPIPDPRSNPHG